MKQGGLGLERNYLLPAYRQRDGAFAYGAPGFAVDVAVEAGENDVGSTANVSVSVRLESDMVPGGRS